MSILVGTLFILLVLIVVIAIVRSAGKGYDGQYVADPNCKICGGSGHALYLDYDGFEHDHPCYCLRKEDSDGK